MAKKKNEILEEQRRAREEFLKLKRMQQGEAVETEKKIYLGPVTLREKAENFWYHNKWYLVLASALVIAISFMLVQCINKEKYDLEVIYFSYTATVDSQTEKIAEYFEKYGEDIDGDGNVNIQVINCSINPNIGDRKYRDSVLQKVQAHIMSGEKTLLYVTDSESVKYFDLMETSVPLFLEETYALDQNFYDEAQVDSAPTLPEGLTVSVRNISGTLLEMKSNIQKYYDASLRLVENLKNK